MQQQQVSDGIPQGSVLSCTCFMIAINDIVRVLPQHVQSTLYVDDFAIYTSGSVLHLMERRIQIAINNLTKWTHTTGFTFSKTKTKSMHICRKRGCPKMAGNITLNGRPIKNVDHYKFLGVHFDSSMTWKHHITMLKASCQKKVALLKHLAHKTWGADRTTLLRLYIMMIKPKLDYGSEAYSSACSTLLDSISPIQNSAVRTAIGAFLSSPIVSIYADSGIKPLAHYRETKLLNYCASIKVNSMHPLHEEINGEANEAAKSFIARAKETINKYNLDMNVMDEGTIAVPPWRVTNMEVCRDLYHIKKGNFTPQELREAFERHMLMHYQETCVYTDGLKTEQGVGYACIGETFQCAGRIPDEASNGTAELIVIRNVLSRVDQEDNLTIVTDSSSAIQALEKIYTRNPLVKQIQAKLADRGRKARVCWVPSHVGVGGNERADAEAKASTTGDTIEQIPIPRSDYKVCMKKKISNE